MKSKTRTTKALQLTLLSAFTAASAGVQAAYVGSLQFITPTGMVGPTDSIDVWVRFTLDPSSDPLVLDGDPYGTPPFGVPETNYPTYFYSGTVASSNIVPDSWTSFSNIYLNTSFLCAGTFTSSCTNGPAYDFSFNTSGPDSLNFLNSYALNPGDSVDYLFGTFTPSAGAVAPGTYYFYGTSLILNFQGTASFRQYQVDEFGNYIQATDENGDPLYDEFGDPIYLFDLVSADDTVGSIDIAVTPCWGNTDPSCSGAFVRTVSAVPVPAAAWLFGSGLIGLVGLARRRG